MTGGGMSSVPLQRTLGDAARVVGGRLVGEDAPYGEVATDSRTLNRGSLFVALRGPNFDGAQFAAAAAARGAVAALIEREVDAKLSQVVVADALAALQTLGSAWRAKFSLPVVGVAGSNGKTTTKEMTAAILGEMGEVLATRGNLNNHIGVPVTLLRLQESDVSAVVEMGANRVGDVAELMQIAKPTVGVITNAGAEHLEGFGDRDGVARGEGEAVSRLSAQGTAIINADDPYAGYWRDTSSARRVLTFGVREPADFMAEHTVAGVEGGQFATRFTLNCPLGSAPVHLQAGGAHNISNALAAAAAAYAAGATLDHIVAGLGRFRPVAGRLQLKAGIKESWIIDDSYNANPSSVRAGLDVLRDLSGEKWLVLGDMAELGAGSLDSHVQLGLEARACGVTRLFTHGPLSARAAISFGLGGEAFTDTDSLARRLEADIAPGITVLIKGSRINRLERVVQHITRAGA